MAGYLTAMQHLECLTSDELITQEPPQIDHVERAMEKWLALPPGDQPDGLVICGGKQHWHGVELALVKRHRCIGLGPDELAAVGNAVGDFSLLFGHGAAFLDLYHDPLINEMYERHLAPALLNKPVDRPIIRVRPELKQLPSLELLNLI